jgi:molybdopterin molybdotransferase
MSTPLISIARARELVLARVPVLPSEQVEIDAALGRVLAADVRATGNVPPFPCSAMDGYAVLAGAAGRVLEIVGESRAGAPTQLEVRDGAAIRISTGAAVPAGATAVIPQEDVTLNGSTIETGTPIANGDHIRTVGEDIRDGMTVLQAGIHMQGVELGAATAAGAATVTVTARPRVAVLCTGDELRAPGEPLGPGEIHNSNAPMLFGLAANAGALTARPQRIPDDHAATLAGISAALGSSDVVIISGGVSVGPHDHVKPVLSELGVGEVFWSVSLQPGKPTWFGTGSEGQLVFGLPGNPVSAVVTFSLFVAPALAAMQGASRGPRALEAEAVLGVDVKRNPRREQAVRVVLRRGDGRPVATPNGAQGSHILSSLIGADALAMIPAGEGSAPAGTVVALEELAR